MMVKRRYTDYNSYLKLLYGERVQKIVVDAGLTCPNRDGKISKQGCIYCNEKGSGSGLFTQGMSITEQIESGKKAMIRRYKANKFLVYFQSFTNTYTTCAKMKAMYDEALLPKEIVGMAIGTRPDCIDKEKLDLIETYTKNHLIWIEYGLQSVHNSTLAIINRGHDFKCFEKAVNMTHNRNINICAHVILGLPQENKKMMIHTAQKLADTGIHGIKLHLLYVIKGTYLAQMWKNGKYQCMNQKDYVETLCDFLEILPKNIIIQRVTGDPHPEELLSPNWAMQRNETFKMIQKTLEKRNSWQGKYLK